MPKTVCVRSLVPKLKNSALSGDLAGEQRGARQLDHRADQIAASRPRPVFMTSPATRSIDRLQDVEFAPRRDQRHHDLGLDRVAGLLGHRDRRLEDRHRLRLVDLGIGDAEPAAAMAEHRVGFVAAHACAGAPRRRSCRSAAPSRRIRRRSSAGTRGAAGPAAGSSPAARA